MSSRASARKDAAEDKARDIKDDLDELEQEIVDEVVEIDERWQAIGADIETLAIRPEAADIRVLETRLVWVLGD